MTPVEYECLNAIRYAMKMHLRWEWEIEVEEYDAVLHAMNYIEDRLWEHLAANPVAI